MRQEARSFLPGLTARPFWDVSNTAWATALAEEWHVVRDEFRAVALRGATSLAAKGNNVWAAAADAGSAASYGPDWRTLVLMDRTTWDPTNAALFPETAALLHRAKVPCVEAFFASMKPDSKISAHSDSCNFVLTAHLGLEIPPGGCKIAVGNETRFWENGEVMLFDTSLLHDAENPTTENRYILMLRVWHPELDEIEVQALQLVPPRPRRTKTGDPTAAVRERGSFMTALTREIGSFTTASTSRTCSPTIPSESFAPSRSWP
ncbi:Aspartyl/Asparaginyl beta-hydroxylase-domain-containing protein [Pelagophyceae sp. CCMP2097]|nr:Aspartyl/Asparaginyl beta-hydroxylase-domain-containing protein [Pelagophyceae sp. CCMP2097]